MLSMNLDHHHHHLHHNHHMDAYAPHQHLQQLPPVPPLPPQPPHNPDGHRAPAQNQPPKFIFKMPRVVPNQKHKFETDELFRRLSRESEVRYTGYRDRPSEERQLRFQNGCNEGHTQLAFVATGTNIQLMLSNGNDSHVNFDKERGKVHIKSLFIMNGVCVRFRGWVDLERLDGVGCLEFDQQNAAIEDALLREQIERYNQRLNEFEADRQRIYQAQTQQSSHLSAQQQQRIGLAASNSSSRCHQLP